MSQSTSNFTEFQSYWTFRMVFYMRSTVSAKQLFAFPGCEKKLKDMCSILNHPLRNSL